MSALTRRGLLLGGASVALLAGCSRTTDDAETGTVRGPLPATPDQGSPKLTLTKVATTPNAAVAGDGVVVMDRADRGREAVRVLDAATGRTLWSLDYDDVSGLPDDADNVKLGAINVGPDRLVILNVDADDGSLLAARDARTGAVRWVSDRTAATLGFTTVLGSATSLVASRGKSTFSFDPGTGKKRWSRSDLPRIAVTGDGVLLGSQPQSASLASLRVVSARTGAELMKPGLGIDASGSTRVVRAEGEILSLELPGDASTEHTYFLRPGKGQRLADVAGTFTTIGTDRAGGLLAVRTTFGEAGPTVILVGDSGRATESTIAQLGSPAAVCDGIIWMHDRATGTVVAADPSGRRLSTAVPGDVESVSPRSLVVRRDGGASPYDVYRIEETR